MQHMKNILTYGGEMTKQEIIRELKETRAINTAMLKTLNMPFEKWLRYAKLKPEKQQNIVDKILKKLESDVF